MIERWESRLAKMDTTKGVSNKMIQTAMQAEIDELRKALWWAEYRLIDAREQRDEWKKKAKGKEVGKTCNCNSTAIHG